MAGFAIFSVLGFMSYEQGLPISEVAATGKSSQSRTAFCLIKAECSLPLGWGMIQYSDIVMFCLAILSQFKDTKYR